MAYGPTRRASCPSQWLSLVCKIPVLLLGLPETNTIGYYGVQATKTFAKIKGLIQEALAKVRGIVKGAIKIIAAQSYRERYHQSSGRDPLRCPHCHHEMDVWKVWHPKYGVVYDELEAMRRGRYASTGRSAAG